MNDRRGFSFAELMASMVIMLLLLSITIANYSEPRDDARRAMARIECERIAQTIRAWQLEKRTNYNTTGTPSNYHGNPVDPWGGSYRIDLATHSAKSPGPDGVFDSADDVTATWEAWTDDAAIAARNKRAAAPPPAPAAVVSAGPPQLTVTQSPSPAKGRMKLTFTCQAAGNELAELRVGTRSYPLSGAHQSIVAEVPTSKTIAVTLTDRAGGVYSTDLEPR